MLKPRQRRVACSKTVRPYEDFAINPSREDRGEDAEYWQAVPVRAALANHRGGRRSWIRTIPSEKLRPRLPEEAEYLELPYKRVLTLCTADEGVSMKQMSAAVDSDLLVVTERATTSCSISWKRLSAARPWRGTARRGRSPRWVARRLPRTWPGRGGQLRCAQRRAACANRRSDGVNW